MAQQSRERLKGWFRKGACPTEAQFADLIDSMTHAGDRFPITRTEGLAEALNGKVGRGELGTLRRLLDDFRGFGALEFGGIDRGERAADPAPPGRIDSLVAAQLGGLEVVYNAPAGRFLLRVDTSVKPATYHQAWNRVEGTFGSAVEASSEYSAGRLYVAWEEGLAVFHSWDGHSEPRPLGQPGAVAGRLEAAGALTPEVAVEHKANSVRLTFGAVGPDGSAGTRTAVIGAVGIKAGLMLPSHARAITDLASQVDGHTNRLWRAEERLGDHEDMISAVDGKAEEARGRVESLEYTHAVDMAELRDLLEGDPVKAAFIEHWITDIGGEYFKETDTFGFRRYVEGELYGPTDLTFAEARRSAWAQVRGGDITGADYCCGRLFLPPLNYINAGLSFHGTTLCYNDAEYMFLVREASCYANVSGGGQTLRIGPMPKLRAVVGRLNITNQAADLSGCPLLELVRFGDLPSSVRLPDSPLLSDTALRWIAESGVPAGRSPVVELHPEAFARLTDAVLEEAASKNITFVTV